MRLSRTFHRVALGALLGTGTIFVSQQALAAYEFYVTIVGRKQGKFRGEANNTSRMYKDRIVGTNFSMGIKSPRDAASGLPTGRRAYSQLCFAKEWGAASPQLYSAASGNEVLSEVTFDFVRQGPSGDEPIYQTIKLTDATVADIRSTTPPATGATLTRAVDEVCFTFKKITIENKDGRTTFTDDWQATQ